MSTPEYINNWYHGLDFKLLISATFQFQFIALVKLPDKQLKTLSEFAYKKHEDELTDFQSRKESNAMHCLHSPVFSASEMMVLGELSKADLWCGTVFLFTHSKVNRAEPCLSE